MPKYAAKWPCEICDEHRLPKTFAPPDGTGLLQCCRNCEKHRRKGLEGKAPLTVRERQTLVRFVAFYKDLFKLDLALPKSTDKDVDLRHYLSCVQRGEVPPELSPVKRRKGQCRYTVLG